MKFLWPEMLWLALLLPLLVAAYLLVLRRKRKLGLTFSSIATVKAAMSKSTGWRRRVPPLLLLCAAVSFIIAAGRPVASITLPTFQRTVILAMDVSLSMSAADVSPNRISASQAAAKAFAAQLPSAVRVGVVAYGGTANLVQTPTLNRDDVIAAIDRFQLQRGTAIGSSIVVSLATLFPEAGFEVTKVQGAAATRRSPLKDEQRSPATPMVSVSPGSYESAAIVLLTDGQNTAGPNPMDAAQLAANRGVKIFTVGFGSREGSTLAAEGWSMRVRLDEETLKNVANLTHGEYFHAGSGADLKAVYESLNSRLVLEKKETEITTFFSDLAALLVLLAVGLSLWWFGRVA